LVIRSDVNDALGIAARYGIGQLDVTVNPTQFSCSLKTPR